MCESFVGLLTSPSHTNLSSCGFYNEWLGCHPGRTADGESTDAGLLRIQKRLSSVLIVWFPPFPPPTSPSDLILAECSWRPRSMMQASQREQEVETCHSHPTTVLWQQPNSLYLVNDITGVVVAHGCLIWIVNLFDLCDCLVAGLSFTLMSTN